MFQANTTGTNGDDADYIEELVTANDELFLYIKGTPTNIELHDQSDLWYRAVGVGYRFSFAHLRDNFAYTDCVLS